MLKDDEILITNFQIESIKGIDKNLDLIFDLENYAAYTSVEKSFLKDFNKPWILYDGRHGLDMLSRLVLDDYIIEYLQTNPLYVFLYEDMETAVGEYVDLPRALIESDYKTVSAAQIQYENTEENLQTQYCYDFHYLRYFKKRNNLNKIYVCSNGFIEEGLKNKYKEFEFIFHSVVLSEESKDALDYACPPYVVKSLPLNHKFWCGNWRYTHHRHIVASYLTDLNVRMSWSYLGTLDELNKGLWFDIKKWPEDKYSKIKKGIEILNDISPIVLTENIKDVTAIEGGIIDLKKYPQIHGKDLHVFPWNEQLYVNNGTISFCAVVTESRFAEHFSSFSEKPLSPIAHFMPFIIVGLPNTLKLLRRVGFQTFSDFWDESYDEEINNEIRLLKILELIDYINNFTLSDLADLKKQMMPILDHNYNVLRNYPFDTPIYN